MSIHSVGGLYGPGAVPQRISQQEGAREPVRQRPPEAGEGHLASRPQVDHQAGAGGDLPLEAPPGTDPQLWSVLTSEERRFFAQARAMGPLTYSRGTLGLAELGLQRGGRLDVRV